MHSCLKLEKLEMISKKRQKGLELIGKSVDVSGKIQQVKNEISVLEDDKNKISSEFESNKNKARELIDRG